MSSFLIEKQTINRIVGFIDRGIPNLVDPHTIAWILKDAEVDLVPGQSRQLAQALYDMNMDAVNCRYEDDTEYIPIRYDPTPANRYQLYKAMSCLEYQCAEGDVPSRPLYKALEALRNQLANALVRESEEYKNEAWG